MSPAGDDRTHPASASAASTTGNDNDAGQLVRKYMLASLGVGLVPVPIADFAALTGIQLHMLARLASIYQVDFSDQLAQSLVASLVGGGGTVLASKSTCNLLLRFIPVAGWVASIASTSLFAGASTFAIGKVFTQHFASGGTFLTFDPEKVRKYYGQQYIEGSAQVLESFVGIRP